MLWELSVVEQRYRAVLEVMAGSGDRGRGVTGVPLGEELIQVALRPRCADRAAKTGHMKETTLWTWHPFA